MSGHVSKRRIAVAFSGASGAIYSLRLLEELVRHEDLEIHLTISPAAREVLAYEQNLRLDLDKFEPADLKIQRAECVRYHRHDDLAAPLSSGSFPMDAMAIVPCSMGCVAAVAHGLSNDLLERAADVMLKERRKLIVVPRETPLSAIHLENLLTLARLGVVVLPACPGLYGKHTDARAMIDFVVGRILDHLEVPHGLGPRWCAEPDTPRARPSAAERARKHR